MYRMPYDHGRKTDTTRYIHITYTALLMSVFAGYSVRGHCLPDEKKMVNFDKLWNYDDPAGTEKSFKKVLPEVKAHDRLAYLELMTQIARAQGLQRKFSEAHATLNSVEKQLPHLSDDIRPRNYVIESRFYRPKVRYLLERGRVYNSSKHPEKAKPYFLKAWDLGISTGLDNFAVDAAHMMGIVEPPESALKWNEKAIKTAEQSMDPAANRWLGSLYNNTGWTYYSKGDYEASLKLLQKAQNYFNEHGNTSQKRIAKYAVAKALRSLGRVDDAYAMQLEVKKEVDRDKVPDGYVSEELAECLLALKRPEEAKAYFVEAYDVLSKDKDFVESEPKRLKRLKEMSGR